MSAGLRADWVAERESPGRLELELRVPLELDCWPGHFPVFSLVPGVLQLDWVVSALEGWLGRRVWIREIQVVKFKELMRPGQCAVLELLREGDSERVQYALRAGDVVFSTGRVRIGLGESR